MNTPPQGLPKPLATAGGVASLLGVIVTGALVAAAAVAGWIGVERFDLALPVASGDGPPVLAVALPELGDGLPAARLDSPAPWRQFSLVNTSEGRIERFWFDLDTWQVRVDTETAAGVDSVEIQADRGYTRRAGTEEWVENDVEEVRNIAGFVMGGIGPFVLTDLIPPNALGFTTLELEGTSRGERVYEVSVDAVTLQDQQPLTYRRWMTTNRLANDGSGVYRVRVRPDGYIVRIDGDTSSVQWDVLPTGVEFFSPLAAIVPTPAVTEPPAAETIPLANVSVPPTEPVAPATSVVPD